MRRTIPWFKGAPKWPLAVAVAMVAIAAIGPMLSPYSPTVGILNNSVMPPAWVEGGSTSHLFGTDSLGRDVLSRILYGARVSLSLSLIAVLFSGTIGTLVGLAAGYWGGFVDLVLMRLVDITLSLPMILVALLLAVVIGPSYVSVVVVVAVLLWPRYARQVRGEALVIREQDYVALARVAGSSDRTIMLRHILPNIVPTLLVLATLQIGYVILLEATLSFLGVGIPPPEPAWGAMVAEGQGYLVSAWWISLFPGLAILVAILSFNFLGDWLRDRLDPKLQQV